MNDCGCDQSGARRFCNHHMQAALEALEAAQDRYPDVLSALGFDPDTLCAGVAELFPPDDFMAVSERTGIPPGECATTMFIDGLCMGVLLAAKAPRNHAAHVLAEAGV